MSLSIELPEYLEAKLRRETESLERFAKEALAVEAYRSGKLSIGQFAELLDIGQYEADGVLKSKGVWLEESDAELVTERAKLDSLLRR